MRVLVGVGLISVHMVCACHVCGKETKTYGYVGMLSGVWDNTLCVPVDCTVVWW